VPEIYENYSKPIQNTIVRLFRLHTEKLLIYEDFAERVKNSFFVWLEMCLRVKVWQISTTCLQYSGLCYVFMMWHDMPQMISINGFLLRYTYSMHTLRGTALCTCEWEIYVMCRSNFIFISVIKYHRSWCHTWQNLVWHIDNNFSFSREL